MPSPATYRKRPVVIDAMQWDGTAEGATPIIDWILDNDGTATFHCISDRDDKECTSEGHTIAIRTLEGVMHTVAGAWVIRGVQGEFYPIAYEIFAATYELVVES